MEHSASAQRARSAAQRLDRNLLFQIFDYLRDGRAFLQCEATCTDFHSLLREESGIGQKLWQARPIAYGARVFATGGTAQNAAGFPERDWRAHSFAHQAICDGTQSYTTLHDLELAGGGRRVVIKFACIDALAVEMRSDGPIILSEVEPSVWTRVVATCFDRAREESRARAPRLFYDVQLTNELVRAATEMVESWFVTIIKKAYFITLHRDSTTLSFRDIDVAGRCADDMTIMNSLNGWDGLYTPRDPRSFVSDLGVAADRVMRRFVRKAGGIAYDGEADKFMWKILLVRLNDLLDRCAFFYMSRENIDMKMVGGNPPSWSREYWVLATPPERRLVLKPDIDDLVHVARHGSGPDDAADEVDYIPGRWWGDDVCSDDGSFRSDDCSDTDDDDDSSIGDESAPPSSVADRLASLASLRASGALTEAEFARQALELGLSGL